MDRPANSGFLQSLAPNRPDDHPVAYDGLHLVRWGDFVQRVEARQGTAGHERRRVLVADASPIDFLVHLLAVLADGNVPVIPPNFQPQTLASFGRLPAPEGLPPASLELYTSGSAGEPKCIRKAMHQLAAECRILERCWGKAAKDATVVATTPHHHIYGLLFRLLWPLSAGRPFDSTTVADPAAFAERLRICGETLLVSSPAQLSRWPELADLPRMAVRPRLIFSSGGPLTPDTARRYAQAWGSPPIEIFGSTETGGIAWRRQVDGNETWQPLPEVRLAAGPDGALLVRSPFLPDESQVRMEDAVEIREDGGFALLGRLDRIAKIEEKRLSLPEMESWLTRHSAVAAAAVATLPIGSRTIVGAVVVTKEGHKACRKDMVRALKSHLGQKYDDVLLPRRWRFVENLPYSERGKLAVDDLVALLSTPP